MDGWAGGLIWGGGAGLSIWWGSIAYRWTGWASISPASEGSKREGERWRWEREKESETGRDKGRMREREMGGPDRKRDGETRE